MYRLIGGKSTGKTSNLMLLAKEQEAIVACRNPIAMQDKAHRYGITGITFVHYEDLLSKKNELRGKTVMIDELEDFVQYQLSTKLQGYTLSNED